MASCCWKLVKRDNRELLQLLLWCTDRHIMYGTVACTQAKADRQLPGEFGEVLPLGSTGGLLV